MQIWIEFGAIGIAIGAALIYKLLTIIQTGYTIEQQKILLPTLMASMVPAAFAFGMWQSWWLAALFCAAAMAIIASKFADKATEPAQTE